MKVALNAMQVRAAKSGVGQYIYGLLGAMLSANHFDQFLMFCSHENIENYRLPARNLENVPWGLSASNKSLRLLNEYVNLPREIAQREADVFHGMSNFLPLRKFCPYVVTIHDLSYFVHPERCPFVRRQYWYAMTRHTVKIADAIITDSENSRHDIVRFFPAAAGKVSVVPLAAHEHFRVVDHGREKSAVAARGITAPYLLFVGTLEPGKNIVNLIRAFDAISAEFPEHHLVIIGDKGWLFEDIFRAAQRAKARNRITITGHVPDDELVDFYNFCDVFVYPSTYEGFGLPPLEAMACGAPVITSAVSSIPEVVGDAAVLVDPYSEREIARAIRRLLSEKDSRLELSRKGREQAAKFSWDTAAQQTLRVYKQLAG
jgi:glycosyltransferase involved in cell wall biosynthesis